MADKVLIVDDDPSICRLLEKVMHSNELETTVADSGLAALNLLKNHSYDMILMDITLGDMEGFDVIKKLRSQGIQTPVMIISGRNEDYDSLYGLSLGADDYITKPFRPLVLGAKVKALIRRNKNMVLDHSDVLDCGPFTYNTSTMRFYKGEEEISLSSKENSLMLLFMKHPGQVFTKDMFMSMSGAPASQSMTMPSWSISTACGARSKRTGRNRSILSQSEDWATVLFLRTGRWQE